MIHSRPQTFRPVQFSEPEWVVGDRTGSRWRWVRYPLRDGVPVPGHHGAMLAQVYRVRDTDRAEFNLWRVLTYGPMWCVQRDNRDAFDQSFDSKKAAMAFVAAMWRLR